MIIGDFHTHTTFCDGKSTPEEMLKSAIDKGLKYYGFSSHSHLKYDEKWNMSHAEQEEYIKEILSLKEKYKDKITVLLGCEYDLLSDNDLSKFDYVIGSCHSILKDGNYVSVDHSEQNLVECVNKYYGGDFYALIKDYYELISTAADRDDITFIGHFDIVSKYNIGYKYFNEDDPRYEVPMFTALDKLVKAGKPFELNTKLVFYSNPAEPLPSTHKWLDAMSELGADILINSDAHIASNVTKNFDDAIKLVSQYCFDSYLIVTPEGLKRVKLLDNKWNIM